MNRKTVALAACSALLLAMGFGGGALWAARQFEAVWQTSASLILIEQANVLKHLRSGRGQQIEATLDQVAWVHIRLLAQEAAQGRPPAPALAGAIDYLCASPQAGGTPAYTPTVAQAHAAWCDALRPKARAG